MVASAAPEDLDQFVSGVGLLDESVECAGLTPLSGECTWERRAMKSVTTIARGIVTMHTAASSGEIQNIIPMTPRSSAPR